MSVSDVAPFIWCDDDLADAVASYERIFGEPQRQAYAYQAMLRMTKIVIADLMPAP